MSGSVRGGSGALAQSELDRRRRNKEADDARTPFALMTSAELKVWAQRLDVMGYGRLRKSELLEKVKVAFAAQA